MEENSATTLEKIQEAALAEFLKKGLLRLLLQQGGPVHRHRRASRFYAHESFYGGPDHLCRTA